MTDDELKTLVREFRASVVEDLEAQHKRMDDLSDEVRQRITTAETAIVNEIRDLSKRIDRRLERIQAHMSSIDDRLDGS